MPTSILESKVVKHDYGDLRKLDHRITFSCSSFIYSFTFSPHLKLYCNMAQTPCTSDNCSLQLQNKQDKIEKLEIELDAVSKALGAVIKANFGLSDEVIRLGGQSIAKACLEDYATIHRNDTGAKRQRRDSAASSSCPPDPESSEQSRVSLVIPMPQGYNWKRLNAEVKEDVADHSQETLDKIAQDADDRLKKAKLVLKQPSEQAQIDEERKAERKAEKNRKAQAAYRE